jgi:hypothetical protein
MKTPSIFTPAARQALAGWLRMLRYDTVFMSGGLIPFDTVATDLARMLEEDNPRWDEQEWLDFIYEVRHARQHPDV